MKPVRIVRQVTGESWKFSAGTHNALCDLIDPKGATNTQGIGGYASKNACTVLIKNATESNRERFEVLKLGTPIYDQTDSPTEFKNVVAFNALDWAGADDETPVILQRSLETTKTCLAAHLGISVAKIEILDADHGYAKYSSTHPEYLESTADAGPIKIENKPGVGDGQYAIVRIGGGAGSPTDIREITIITSDVFPEDFSPTTSYIHGHFSDDAEETDLYPSIRLSQNLGVMRKAGTEYGACKVTAFQYGSYWWIIGGEIGTRFKGKVKTADIAKDEVGTVTLYWSDKDDAGGALITSGNDVSATNRLGMDATVNDYVEIEWDSTDYTWYIVGASTTHALTIRGTAPSSGTTSNKASSSFTMANATAISPSNASSIIGVSSGSVTVYKDSTYGFGHSANLVADWDEDAGHYVARPSYINYSVQWDATNHKLQQSWDGGQTWSDIDTATTCS